MGHLDLPLLRGAHKPPLADHLGAGAACFFLGSAQPRASPYSIRQGQAGRWVGDWVVEVWIPGQAACL